MTKHCVKNKATVKYLPMDFSKSGAEGIDVRFFIKEKAAIG